MNIASVLKNLTFIDTFESRRQKYYIYEGKTYFISATYNDKRKTGNFNAISKKACDVIIKKFRGKKGITDSEILKELKNRKDFKITFDVLNALYVLCAMKKVIMKDPLSRRSKIIARARGKEEKAKGKHLLFDIL